MTFLKNTENIKTVNIKSLPELMLRLRNGGIPTTYSLCSDSDSLLGITLSVSLFWGFFVTTCHRSWGFVNLLDFPQSRQASVWIISIEYFSFPTWTAGSGLWSSPLSHVAISSKQSYHLPPVMPKISQWKNDSSARYALTFCLTW